MEKLSTNITPAHRDAFNAMLSGKYDNFALFSCFVNGEPTSAITVVTVNPDTDEQILTPLVVFITDGMVLEDHDGRKA